MATTGKKEYTLKINGIDTAIKNVTTLETAVNSLDAALGKVNTTNVNSTRTTRERARALSEEEKAEQRLTNTIDKVVQARSNANRAQIEANIAAREAQREVTREIQIRQQAEGSIRQMGLQLTDLRNQYEGLSRAQREDINVGGELLQQIQALDAEYKGLRESTGNFRDSVGNYSRALEGLNSLSEGFDSVSRSTMGVAQALISTNQLISLFGDSSNENAEQVKRLQQIIALLSIAQQINNNVIRQGIVQNKAAAIVDGIRTTQLKAKAAAEALSTRRTIAATAAQAVFNVVASANPYVLLALALVAVGAALFAFASGTDNAAESQKRLNDLQSNYLDRLDEEANKTKRVSNERIQDLERQLRVLQAQENKQKEIYAVEDQIAVERRKLNRDLGLQYSAQLLLLDSNQNKLDEYRKVLIQLQNAQARGVNKLNVDVDLNGSAQRLKVDEAIEIIQGKVDNLDRSVQVAVELNTNNRELDAEEIIRNERRAQESRDAARERARIETETTRAAEDTRFNLIRDTNERARQQTQATYDRQIEDLRTRLTNETTLSVQARKNINDQIVGLEQLRNTQIQQLRETENRRLLDLERRLQDSTAALINGEYDRRRAETNLSYQRQIEDYQTQLNKLEEQREGASSETLSRIDTEQQAITKLMVNAEEARGAELLNITAEELNARAELELSAAEDRVTAVQNKVQGSIVRNKTGLELIDVDATRKNLEATNAALENYIKELEKYLLDYQAASDITLATLQEGTTEYEAELQKRARVEEDVARRIKEAQKDQAENTEKSSKVQVDALRELFSKISEYADAAAMAVTSVMDTWNMGLQVQIDDLNEQLDAINERYEEAQKQREDAVNNVEKIEEQLQSATGGTTEALKSQLQDAMHARSEAEREENRLAKEKQKLEADVAKREKQMRRNDLISKIAQGFANTALGVTQALSLVFPLNLVVAGIVGAMGLVQTGIMTKQLTRLADGGEIIGPSHASGGVPIPGTNYEVEGGEFVINKRSYGANANLINFINETPRAITAADLLGVVPGDTTPVVITESGQASEDRIVEAINGINFQPVVSVTDINNVSDEVVTVQDLAGF